jgi:hypothetical protein
VIRTRDLTLTKGALYRWSYGSISIDAPHLHEIMTPWQVRFWPVGRPSLAGHVGPIVRCRRSQLQQPAHDGAGAAAEQRGGEERTGGALAGIAKSRVGRDDAGHAGDLAARADGQ